MRKAQTLRLLTGGVGLTLLLIGGLAPAGASSANISHSYSTAASITSGSLVSLDPTRTNFVLPANSSNGGQLLGVAVDANDSLLAVDPSTNSGVVQVATSGQVNTLVSNLNGNINVGDQIAASPFNGVGMKAVPGSHVIGLAQTTFNAQTAGSNTEQVTDKSGHTNSVLVGYIKLGIAIGTATTQGSGEQLNGLQRMVKTLTGHTVSTARAFVSLVVALVATITLVTLIYASIYGGVISVGRNPLAKYSIFRSLFSVMIMALATAVIAAVTIYFLLH